MQLPQPQARPFNNIAGDIETGTLLIPQFQRDFVWSMKKSAELMDSILKGYPIGTFILWHTQERMRSVRGIGGQKFPVAGENDFVDFVLDGQQRLTSIYACLKGLSVSRDSGRTDNFENIFVDLKACGDEPIVRTDIAPLEHRHCVSIKLLCEGFSPDLAKLDKKYHDKIRDYYKRITAYSYSIIQLSNAPLDVATEVFTRINTAGKTLDMFDVMVAKTYDQNQKFDLAEKWGQLKDYLGEVGYETISPMTVLRTVALIAERDCQKTTILKMDRKKFIQYWDRTEEAIKAAVDYFRDTCRIPVSKLLPYDALVASYAWFFSRQNTPPDDEQTKLLQDFFWRVALSQRYTSSLESKLAEDTHHMEAFHGKKAANYHARWGVNASADYVIEHGNFSIGRAYIKAILCLYCYMKPRPFNNNGREVILDNSWLKQTNSKNYHHFFPKEFLKKRGEKPKKINHIVNITIVDDFLNKKEIRSQAPSIYMKRYRDKNPSLAETMRTHLIGDLDKFGVFEDDYDKFRRQRAEMISQELTARLIPHRMDGKKAYSIDDDEEEEEPDAK